MRNRQYDGECIVCHTVGYGVKTGYESEEKTPIIAYHFAWPGYGHIAKTSEGFHYYPEAMSL